MNKIEILKTALAQREEEVFEHQINIDNYRRAIPRAKDDPDLADFAVQLEGLLASSLIEQKKAQILVDVLNEQINEQYVLSEQINEQ